MASIAAGAILAAVTLIVFGLLITAFVSTAKISMTAVTLETITFHTDSPLYNLLILLLGGTFLVMLQMLIDLIPEKQLTRILFFAVLLLGTVFTVCARSTPTHDSYSVTYAGIQMSKGNSLPLQNTYFRYYPFQLGYVAWTEGWSRITGIFGPYLPLQIINVLCLACGETALLAISDLIFQSERQKRFTFLLLLFFPQAIWFCTFLYGNIPSFAFAAIAVWLLLLFLKKEKWWLLLLSTISILMAVWMKLNSLIVFVAMVIILLLDIVQKQKWKLLAGFAAFLVLIPVGKDLPIRFYEARTGYDFGSGIPMVAWASMGLHTAKGDRPGWNNGALTTGVYDHFEHDPDKTSAYSLEKIKERLADFSENPSDAVFFFGKKIASQWNESTFQSIWNVQVRGVNGKRVGIAKLICDDQPALFTRLCDVGHMINLLGACVGLVLLFRRRRAQDALLPLIILGGFLYHLIFEAKSQYVMVYLLWMIPIAGYGWQWIQEACTKCLYSLLQRKKDKDERLA